MLQSYYKLAKWQNKHAYELFLYFGLSIKRYFCRNFVPLSLYNYVGALVLSLISFLPQIRNYAPNMIQKRK